jgi:hypothetical protein
MTTVLPRSTYYPNQDAGGRIQAMAYEYDQLNRLRSAHSFRNFKWKHAPGWDGYGNRYNYGARIYNLQVARFLSVDLTT